jgi:hypothetical protein
LSTSQFGRLTRSSLGTGWMPHDRRVPVVDAVRRCRGTACRRRPPTPRSRAYRSSRCRST